jgi:hypothetical protein
VLDDVGDGRRDDEVRTRLDVRRQALAQHLELDGEDPAGYERVDAGAEPAVGEDRGQDPVCELAHLVCRELRSTVVVTFAPASAKRSPSRRWWAVPNWATNVITPSS